MEEKRKWDVYQIYESYENPDFRFVGSTYATNCEKAIANVRYRTKIKDSSDEHGQTYLQAYPA